VINEVGSNPGGLDWNQDGTASNTQDEFVELVSTSASAVELQGVQLKDGQGNLYTFPSLCLEGGYAVVVFANGTPFGTVGLPAGNAAAQTGLPALNNTAESLELLSATGTTIDNWSETSALTGESRVRDPEKTGAFVPHKTATGSNGAAASPGRCTNGLTFPTCL